MFPVLLSSALNYVTRASSLTRQDYCSLYGDILAHGEVFTTSASVAYQRPDLAKIHYNRIRFSGNYLPMPNAFELPVKIGL